MKRQRINVHRQRPKLELVVEALEKSGWKSEITQQDHHGDTDVDEIAKKPDQQTNILIPHKYADKPEGDDFGAALCTYKDYLDFGNIYYRHFFQKVEPNQPASKMKIKDGDELLLLNEVFVPALMHREVLNLFHGVKVDGKTRLSLVIRRKLIKQKWEWIETSAVLSPENQIYADLECRKLARVKPICRPMSKLSYQVHGTEKYLGYRDGEDWIGNKRRTPPAVTDLKYNEVDGDKIIYRPMSQHFYKVPGSEKYVDIRDCKVWIDTMNSGDNKTKIIWKHPKIWQADTEGHINFATTLCDMTKKWYIAIDPEDQITVEPDPVWFKMIKTGSNIRFQFRKLYLGYNLKNDEMQAQVTDYLFEELPAPSVGTVDGSVINKQY
ncbi:uncharacterized protein LOC123554448 [Mercenaria mercenaria]|uniref:uncharacterized protein LOC123554448 n=1 Tax=Mercenaria mercenaria TaxID=6596 RepID=UPI00234FAE86|nr:uncharacterized protein LOC123554448 [Mercenaria mercenaria]